jgi:hypothetical protein
MTQFNEILIEQGERFETPTEPVKRSNELTANSEKRRQLIFAFLSLNSKFCD